LNYQSKVGNGIVIQSKNSTHYFGGKQKEFEGIISDLKIEIEKLKTIRLRYFWNSDLS